MDFAEYALVLINNQLQMVFIFLIFAAVYYFAFYRKLSFNVFDSYTIELISSAGSALTVYIMFAYGSPDPKFLFSFITCEVALYGAIFLMRRFARKASLPPPVADKTIRIPDSQKEYLRLFFQVVFLTYVFLQFLSFKLVGLLLFSADEGVTHVNAYNDFGPLFTILFVMTPVFTVCLFLKRKIFGKFTWFDYACMAVAIFSMFTSGSKSSFVSLFTAFAVVDYKFAKLYGVPKTKVPAIFLVILFLSIIAILSFNSITALGDDTAIDKLYQRLALSGDCFVIGYDDSALRFVRNNGPSHGAFSYIFYPLYGKFVKLFVSSPVTPSIVGLDLYYYAFGVDDAGSNGRHDFLSVLFWGPYWGWMLSFMIGSFIGFMRFYVFEKVGMKNIFYLVFICIITTFVPICITDVYLFTSMLFFYFVLFIFFLIMMVVVFELKNIFMAMITHYVTNTRLKKQLKAGMAG